MVKRAAGIARIDFVHAAARHIGGELVHGQELGVGLLADPHGIAGMVLMPMRERHMRHALDRLMQRNPGILERGVAGEERIDQDAAPARVDAEAGMAEPRNLHASNLLMRLLVTVAPLVPIEDLPPLLSREARLLGLDVGTKTIGMALSDVTRSVATPYHTVRRTKFTEDAKAIEAAIEEHDVGAVVIGLPLNLDGSEGPRAQSTRAFARNLAARIAVPILFWDERLSTAAVERHLIEADASRKRRAEVIDRMAAAYILQGALDRLKRLSEIG